MIDYVLAKVTGAEFNIFTSVVENLAFGAVGKIGKLGVNMVQRSPNTINALLQAARRGIKEHTRWSEIVLKAINTAGRPGGALRRLLLNQQGHQERGRQGPAHWSRQQVHARPDFVDY